MPAQIMPTVVVIGPSTCGKSAVVRAYLAVNRAFAGARDETHDSTATIIDEYRLTRSDLTVVDTGGMDVYWALMSEQLARADVVIYVFDVTRRDTLTALPTYLVELRATRGNAHATPLVVCANKIDSPRSFFAPTRDARVAEVFRQAVGFTTVRYVEVSAHSGDNMEVLFNTCQEVLATTREPTSARSDGSTPRSSGSPSSSPRTGCQTM